MYWLIAVYAPTAINRAVKNIAPQRHAYNSKNIVNKIAM